MKSIYNRKEIVFLNKDVVQNGVHGEYKIHKNSVCWVEHVQIQLKIIY